MCLWERAAPLRQSLTNTAIIWTDYPAIQAYGTHREREKLIEERYRLLLIHIITLVWISIILSTIPLAWLVIILVSGYYEGIKNGGHYHCNNVCRPMVVTLISAHTHIHKNTMKDPFSWRESPHSQTVHIPRNLKTEKWDWEHVSDNNTTI